MPAKSFLRLVSGRPKVVAGVVTSAGSANDGDIPSLDANGRLDVSLMPSGIGPAVKTMPCSENLAAGDIVNVFNDSGVLRCRKADASSAGAGRRAHGFVQAAFTSGQTATVFYGDLNSSLSGLTIGAEYYLSHTTAGGVVAVGGLSATAGHIVQRVGVAMSATEILVEIQEPIEL